MTPMSSRDSAGTKPPHCTPARAELLVQSALLDVLGPITATLTGRGVSVRCVEDVTTALRIRPRQLVALSAFTDLQLVAVSRVAAEHPLAAVIATITDATGRQTHAAMRAGAALVLNTLISVPHLTDVLYTFARVYAHQPNSPVPDPSRCPADGTASPSGGLYVPRSAMRLENDDTDLLRLLVGNATTAEIASRYYRSERSMYRRLRALYTHLGVKSRQELRELSLRGPQSELDPVRRSSALRS
jgi:DNA-binding NarL/FixJ family response regulator